MKKTMNISFREFASQHVLFSMVSQIILFVNVIVR